jgi:hypothetical protein
MKNFMTGVVVIIAIPVTVAAIGIGGYHLYAYLAPQYESTRRDVMLNSRVYDEGTKRELYRLKLQYTQAGTDAEKAVIAAAARHEFQIFPRERLPVDLQAFMDQVEGK